MKGRTVLASLLLVVLLALPSVALAKPEVTINMVAEKEIVVVEDGKEVTKRVPTEDITPGEIIFYTLALANQGDEEATNLKINNPIPEGAAYLPGSASEEQADVTFSIDGGQTYKKPSLLTYEVKTAEGKIEKHTATPEQYTHIRWIIEKLEAGQQGQVSFQVKVK